MKTIKLFLLSFLLSFSVNAQLVDGLEMEEKTPDIIGLSFAMDMQFLTDNVQIILTRGGDVRVYDNYNPRETNIITKEVAFTSEGGGLSGLHKKINGVDYYWLYSTQEATPKFGTITLYTLDILNNTATEIGDVFTGFFNSGFNHQGGTLMWHEGWLYLSLGDGGFRWYAQRDSREAGSIIRLDPFSGGGHPENPLYNANNPTSAESLQYTEGLRNPWRSVMRDNGDIFVADVGAGRREEVTLITQAGQNAQWPFYEGYLEKDLTPPQNPDTGQPYVLDNDVLPLFTVTHHESGFYYDGGNQFQDFEYESRSILGGAYLDGQFGLGKAFLFMDFWRDDIMLCHLTADDEVVGFGTLGTFDFNGVTDIVKSGDQLFYLTLGGRIYEMTGSTLSIENPELPNDPFEVVTYYNLLSQDVGKIAYYLSDGVYVQIRQHQSGRTSRVKVAIKNGIVLTR